MKEYLLVGTYTTIGAPGCGEDTVCGKGVYCYSYDSVMGQTGDMTDMLEMENPSYLTTDESGNLLFAVNEIGNANVVVLCSQREGKLGVVDRLSSGRAAICHVVYKENRGLLAIANYMSGSMSIATVRDRQKLERRLHIRHQGKGSVGVKQEMSHVHSYLFHEGYLLVADLGLGRTHLYRMVDRGVEFLEDIGTRAGNGPRHMTAHREGDGTWLYVVNELSCDVSVYRFRVREFQETQKELLYDGPSMEDSLAIDIYIIKNEVLYILLRGTGQVVWFQTQHGSLRRMGSMGNGGGGPRNLCFDREERHLIVTNQFSGNLAVCPMEREVVQRETIIHFPVSVPVKVLTVQG